MQNHSQCTHKFKHCIIINNNQAAGLFALGHISDIQTALLNVRVSRGTNTIHRDTAIFRHATDVNVNKLSIVLSSCSANDWAVDIYMANVFGHKMYITKIIVCV